MLRSCFLSNFFESCSAVSEEKSKMSQPIMGHGSHLFFTDRPEKHRLGKGCWDLASCQVSSFCSAVSEKKSKMPQPIRGWGGHLVFLISPKNTNWVKGVEILLPVKLHWIPFSGFREEVENVSANQRPGRPSFFPIGPKNKNLVEDI